MIRWLSTEPTLFSRPGAGTRRAIGALLFGWAITSPPPAVASADLQVAPVLLEVPSGGSVTGLTISNLDSKPAAIQVRVFRWTQADGEETLTPTEDVVASPPFATIDAHGKLSVRVIRAAKSEVVAEEAYRLVLDQLPQSDAEGRTNVAMLVRQVLPVFFEPAERGAADVAWTIARNGRDWTLRARNAGARRLRIARMVVSGAGKPISMGGGLLGYALAHSEMSWTLPARKAHFAAGARLSLGGESDVGALHATATVSAAQ